jgi:hypothetical protein
MRDMIEAESLKELHAILELKIILCTLARNFSA